MQPEVQEQWDLYRQGNKAAFEKIYFAHVNLLYDYGIRMTRNTALVEDCIQDLFSDLWEKRMQINAVEAVRPYLLVAIRRRILRKLTQEQRSSLQHSQEWPIKLQNFTPDGFDTELEERMTGLRQAFAKLSERQKEVVYLRFYNQLSYEEIANVMAVHVKAIYKLMARAIQVLRMHISTPTLSFFLFVISTT